MGLLDFLARFFGVPASSARLDVLEETEQRCVIRGDAGVLVLDLQRRIVDLGGGTRLPFAQFAGIGIQHYRDDEDRPEQWQVSLLPQRRSRVVVGTSQDDVQASIAAATLARHLGCDVRLV